MKKFLPTSINLSVNKKGFTLIELLVVISIIAVLAVIGFVAYQGVTGRARDTKRMAEIDAIQLAMEKGFVTSTGKYIVLKDGDFANNIIPTDPFTTVSKCGSGKNLLCEYCGGTAAVVINTTTLCGFGDKISGSAPAAGVTSYRVCATLENPAGNLASGYLYCKSSTQ